MNSRPGVWAGSSWRGGGTLVRAFLDLDLGDEFHRFQQDTPAGGPALDLALPLDWQIRAQARWPGGHWDVWR